MHRRIILLLLLITTLAFLPATVAQQPQPPMPQVSPQEGKRKQILPRYGVIDAGKLSRSGMPKDERGWVWLRQQGVKSVVEFRQVNDVDYKKFGFEKSLWLPFNHNEPPTNELAEKFLRFVQDADNWPVHIHCAEGKSRTGMMAALVRYAVDGWSVDKALEEARLYRRGKDLSPAQTEWLRNWAAKHKPGSHPYEKQ